MCRTNSNFLTLTLMWLNCNGGVVKFAYLPSVLSFSQSKKRLDPRQIQICSQRHGIHFFGCVQDHKIMYIYLLDQRIVRMEINGSWKLVGSNSRIMGIGRIKFTDHLFFLIRENWIKRSKGNLWSYDPGSNKWTLNCVNLIFFWNPIFVHYDKYNTSKNNWTPTGYATHLPSGDKIASKRVNIYSLKSRKDYIP